MRSLIGPVGSGIRHVIFELRYGYFPICYYGTRRDGDEYLRSHCLRPNPASTHWYTLWAGTPCLNGWSIVPLQTLRPMSISCTSLFAGPATRKSQSWIYPCVMHIHPPQQLPSLNLLKRWDDYFNIVAQELFESASPAFPTRSGAALFAGSNFKSV